MTATDTYLLLNAFCDELARCGMRHACTSPGSRNTPLVLSLVRERRLDCFSHIDERCAGFFALGAAKASGRPVAVTCTSGTAVTNLVPAVTEAFHARVPLVVLSADRPPELRELGAGQTIDQLKLFGAAVKWFFEVGVHDAGTERLRWIRTLACRAYFTALSGPAGPVHLNFPLREPLVLDGPLPGDPTGREDGQPYVRFDRPAPAAGLPEQSQLADRSVIIAGAGAVGPQEGKQLASLAARSEIPLLADPQSGARRGPAAIAHYDLLLRDPTFSAAHRPQFVIRVGELPTSKPLRRWLAGLHDVEQIAIDPDQAWQDPDVAVRRRIVAPTATFADARDGPAVPNSDPDWLGSWRRADAAMAEAIAGVLEDQLTEPSVAIQLTERLPPQATLLVASSMPVRDLEEFAPVSEDGPRVLSNRGANGIDGTASAAFGVAAVSEGPVVVLIGDVALAHDIGGLLAARRLELALTIVLLNNDGGGIFHFLPVAEQDDAFEQHVATPHGLDFAHAAALYGCDYQRPRDLEAFHQAVAESIEGGGTTIVEVHTDRGQNLALHRRVAQAATGALREASNQPRESAASSRFGFRHR